MKARRDIDRRRVCDILRIAGVPYPPTLRRVHRVGTWKSPLGNEGELRARPILVEFADEATRDRLLARAAIVAQITKGRYQIVPDEHRVRPGGLAPGGNLARPARALVRNLKGQRNAVLGSHVPTAAIVKKPRAASQIVVIEDALEDENWQYCPKIDDSATPVSLDVVATPIEMDWESSEILDHQPASCTPVGTSEAKNVSSSQALRLRNSQV